MTNVQNDNFYLNALTAYMGLVIATKCKIEVFSGGMSGNWVCPPDVNTIYVLGIGAGAGAGGGQHPQAGAAARAGQAGGGSNPMFVTMKTIPGNSYAYNVPVGGLGGAGGTASATTGVDGADGLNATFDYIKFFGANKGTKGSTAPVANGEVSGGVRKTGGGAGGVSGGASSDGSVGTRTIYNDQNGSLPGASDTNSWASGGGGGGGFENGGNGGDGGTVITQNSVRLAKIKADLIGDNYSLDTSPSWQIYNYFVNPGFNNDVLAVAYQPGPNPRLIVGGAFTIVNNVNSRRIARIDSAGIKDNSFNIGAPLLATSGFNNTVRAIAVDSLNRIYVGGDFTQFDTSTASGFNRNRIIRLDSSGGQDFGFDIGSPSLGTSGFNNVVRAIAIQPDGKILVGGDFTTYKGVTVNRFCRIDANGALDTTFNTNVGIGPNNSVYGIAIQPNGDIFICGAFTSYKGVTKNRLCRVIGSGLSSTHGNLDTSFVTPAINNLVRTVYIQPDGNVLIGGDFTSVGIFTGLNRILRLTSTGVLDTQAGTHFTGSFLPGNGANNSVYQIIASPRSGRVLAIGAFTQYSGLPYGKIAEIDIDNSHGQYDGYPNAGNIEIGTGASVAFTALISFGSVFIGSNGVDVSQLNHVDSGNGHDGGVGAGGGGGGVAPKKSNLYFPNSGKGGDGGDAQIIIAYIEKS
jgi:hypothetical protein